MTIDWEVFSWIVGIIIGFACLLFWRYFDGTMKNFDERVDEVEDRLKETERCKIDNEIALTNIKKDIEYIKLEQEKISLKIDELLQKAWCRPKNK